MVSQSAARLKNISAKHLGITSESLSLLMALLPHMRAALLALLPPKRHMLLTELDRTSQVLIEHHGKVLSKFVAIISESVEQSAKRLSHVQWESFTGRLPYFEELTKNVTALHRVLDGLLPADQLREIFSRIVAVINRRVPVHFEEVRRNVRTELFCFARKTTKDTWISIFSFATLTISCFSFKPCF